MNRHNRKSIRLKNYDYSKSGYYFVTICTHQNKNIFWNNVVAGSHAGQMHLSAIGQIAHQCWLDIPLHYPNIELDKFIIMPTHMHGILIINNNVRAGSPRPINGTPNINNKNNNDFGRGNRAPTLGQIVAYFKYGTTKQINEINQTPGTRLWQRSFHDHIIRDEKSLNTIRKYIINNPLENSRPLVGPD